MSYSGCQDPPDLDVRAQFEEIAATYLWEWTGRRFGTCDEVIRPCRQGCDEAIATFMMTPFQARLSPQLAGLYGYRSGFGGWLPVLIGGLPFPVACGSCGLSDGCSCGFVPSIRLPGPVSSVTAVTIDGAVLDPSAWRLDGARLVRTDGQHWPNCQDMSLPLGQPGTWSVDYQRGLPVPAGGQVAAGTLASELAKAACGDTSCKLPSRLQTITRQGVTMAMLDDFSRSLEKGYTGIWVVDSWIASVNGPRPAAVVMSPDYRRPGRT